MQPRFVRPRFEDNTQCGFKKCTAHGGTTAQTRTHNAPTTQFSNTVSQNLRGKNANEPKRIAHSPQTRKQQQQHQTCDNGDHWLKRKDDESYHEKTGADPVVTRKTAGFPTIHNFCAHKMQALLSQTSPNQATQTDTIARRKNKGFPKQSK